MVKIMDVSLRILDRVRDVLVLRLPFMVDCKVSYQVKNQVTDKARNTLENQINDKISPSNIIYSV